MTPIETGGSSQIFITVVDNLGIGYSLGHTRADPNVTNNGNFILRTTSHGSVIDYFHFGSHSDPALSVTAACIGDVDNLLRFAAPNGNGFIICTHNVTISCEPFGSGGYR